jgi:hypothetical protein
MHPPDKPRPAAWLRDPGNLPFLALLVLYVVPLWAFRFFPSQDGPTHLENAVILREHHRRPFLQEFYDLNTHFDPNWFGHLVLAGLMSALPVLAAEKVLLTGYLVLLPLSARYALNAVRPGAGFLAVLAFPFAQNFLYHMGFFNFSYSLAVFFLVVGYWLRHQARFGPRQTLTLAALVMLLYFCHLVSVVMALLVVGTLGLAWTLLDLRKAGARAAWDAARSRLVLPACAFVPAVLLGLAFLGRQGAAAASEFSAAALWQRLWQLEVLVSYFPGERLLAVALCWGLLGLSAWVLAVRLRTRRLGGADALLLVAALAVVAYFAAPSSLSGGSFVNTRLSLFPFFILLLWLGTHPFGPVGRRLIEVAAALAALGLLALHGLAYARFNDYLAEYASAREHLRPDTSVLPLTFTWQLHEGGLGDAKVGAFRHAAGYLAAEDGVVELDNYEADTSYFPVRFKEGANPFRHIGVGGTAGPTHFLVQSISAQGLAPAGAAMGALAQQLAAVGVMNSEAFTLGGTGPDEGLQAQPPRVRFLTYPQRTGRPLDFVLLWNVRPEQRHDPAGRAVFEQLKQGYDLVFTSPRGLLQLYRRKDSAPR